MNRRTLVSICLILSISLAFLFWLTWTTGTIENFKVAGQKDAKDIDLTKIKFPETVDDSNDLNYVKQMMIDYPDNDPVQKFEKIFSVYSNSKNEPNGKRMKIIKDFFSHHYLTNTDKVTQAKKLLCWTKIILAATDDEIAQGNSVPWGTLEDDDAIYKC